MKSNLLATKLHRPALPVQWVKRPSLTQKLHEGLVLNRQLTLVSAPAGFGKTTCITEWLNTLESCPVAWLSLDAADNDPGRFFAYLIAALQSVDAYLGQELAGVLQSGQLPAADMIGTGLVNDILTIENRFLLVLDDFHLIQDTFILQVLETIIANQPLPLHLVLITREDPPLPLARLRANNRLTEIRAKDLRFSNPDVACFLNDVLNLALSAADVAALEAKTEGWIVGLQLAGLSVRDRTDPSAFIANLSGSHRFILDYLAEQVLSRQPDEIQRFLLQTSILDKLNSELCNAVTERADGRSRLNHLFNANLFLIPLDDEQQWYRYHHLFADLLRDRQVDLGKQETAVLHQRASQWYAQEKMINEAMHHALAAEDFGTAVTLLEDHALHLIMQGYVKTVNGWLETIPERWRSQSHRTNLAFAWMHLLRGAYSQAAPYLARLGNSFSSSPAEEAGQSIRAEWLVMQALLLNMEGKSEEGLALASEALATVPEQDGRVRSLAYFGLASANQALERYEAAAEAYQKAIHHGQVADNLIAEMLSVSGLAMMAFERGQLHLAYEIAAPVSDRIEQAGALSPITTVVYGILGEIYYQWFQTEAARRHFQRALELSTLGGYKSGMVNCRVLLSRLYQLVGDLETAAHQIKEATALIQLEIPDYVRQEIVAQQVHVYLAQDRAAAAQTVLQEQGFAFDNHFAYPVLPSDQSISYSPGLLYNSSLRFLLYQTQAGRELDSLQAGIELGGDLIERARRGRCTAVALEALLLRAQMHNLLGNYRASQQDYVNSMRLGAPEGFIGVFVEQGQPVAAALTKLARQHRLDDIQPGYVERLLAAFAGLPASDSKSDGTALQSPTLIDPLTERELEVLGLMAEGLKYKEIAAKLIVSVNTVRYHVKAIYGKLNVNNRTQAIETARQHQLL
ncbi:MAG: hypothetical protein CL608_08240 [Anaerolineaceae bacterium]|nr:hypothetical protein [Anaerolineaceae bacterium]